MIIKHTKSVELHHIGQMCIRDRCIGIETWIDDHTAAWWSGIEAHLKGKTQADDHIINTLIIII